MMQELIADGMDMVGAVEGAGLGNDAAHLDDEDAYEVIYSLEV